MNNRGKKYVQHDELIRKMCDEGNSLSQMCSVLHCHNEDLKYYIEQNNIAHAPFVKARHGKLNGRWTGGRIVDEDGYVLIKSSGHPFADRHNYVREHRLVMEKKLGRYLLPSEVVHHIDDNKQNNDPENLELFSRNSDHLAKTLKGKVPKWTPDGIQRILEGVRKSRVVRQTSNPKQ